MRIIQRWDKVDNGHCISSGRVAVFSAGLSTGHPPFRPAAHRPLSRGGAVHFFMKSAACYCVGKAFFHEVPLLCLSRGGTSRMSPVCFGGVRAFVGVLQETSRGGGRRNPAGDRCWTLQGFMAHYCCAFCRVCRWVFGARHAWPTKQDRPQPRQPHSVSLQPYHPWIIPLTHHRPSYQPAAGRTATHI